MPKGFKGRTVVEKECVVCGKPFTKVLGQNDHVKTCSKRCGGVYANRNRTNKFERKCKVCGTVFETTPFNNQRYCSKACLYRRNEAKYSRTCEVCGEPFKIRAKGEETRTCSLRCGYLLREGVVGERYEFWKRLFCELPSGRFKTDAVRKKNRSRKSQVSHATPAWADREKVDEFYKEAKERSEFFGEPYHVDHIIPLKHRLVCGLHNEFNLRVVRRGENLKKGNNFDDE